MPRRVLHVLAQRPAQTGSGVTLEALVREGAAAGWDQHVVVGVPADEPAPALPPLTAGRVHALRFGEGELDFPVPGMSDVMPYPSTRFSSMSPEQLARYRGAWRQHLAAVLAEARPDVIHAHHVWLVAALLKELAPEVPLVIHCHATGLRQLKSCPHLGQEILRGCARADRFATLHAALADELASTLQIPRERVSVVGAGYRDDLFRCGDDDAARGRRIAGPRGLPPLRDETAAIVYVGKLSAAKGLPSLLDAFEALAPRLPGLELHLAGSGAGAEADALRARAAALGPSVVLHGQLAQPALAALMRRAAVCVLPSLYEGVPLVLVEALACGCRLVATALPGVVGELAPHLGEALELVELPQLVGADQPVAGELPAFAARLAAALERSLARPPLEDPRALEEALRPFGWGAVFERVQAIWTQLALHRGASAGGEQGKLRRSHPGAAEGREDPQLTRDGAPRAAGRAGARTEEEEA